MIDIFKLFHVETKEDIYTYCLIAMLENGDSNFKKRVGEQFGFEEDDYQVTRGTFKLSDGDESPNRLQITPDLILHNPHHISIVESKMFSSEGWSQTEDYTKGAETIKRTLNEESASVAFYFLTLSGIVAESKYFIPVKWTNFYEAILRETSFEDETLEFIRKTILAQTEKYKKFESAMETQPYRDLFNKDTYWITPLTLFSSGTYNNIWQSISGEEKFSIRNGVINGTGHSEFTTDLYKQSWRKYGTGKYDNIHLFIRIDWREDPVVWLCWEYFCRDTGEYVPTKEITPPDFRIQAIESLRKYKDNWKGNEASSNLAIKKTDKRRSSIKALKHDINGDKDISDVIEEIKSVVQYYSEEIHNILNALFVTNGYLKFNEEQYNCKSQI